MYSDNCFGMFTLVSAHQIYKKSVYKNHDLNSFIIIHNDCLTVSAANITKQTCFIWKDKHSGKTHKAP